MTDDRRDPDAEDEEQETPAPKPKREGRGGRPQEQVERAVKTPPERR